jgi:hypothetical protein
MLWTPDQTVTLRSRVMWGAFPRIGDDTNPLRNGVMPAPKKYPGCGVCRTPSGTLPMPSQTLPKRGTRRNAKPGVFSARPGRGPNLVG